MRLRLPEEHPAEPPVGYKIAYPVLSQDGTGAAFLGISLGGAEPYGVLARARCAYGRRHAPPVRRCDCGFHCLHDRAEAEGLLCPGVHSGALLLEVAVLGRYLRFERGMRYARQRVRSATAGPCRCGAVASLLGGTGRGLPGWRIVEPMCAGCVRARRAVSLAEFAGLAGEGLRVTGSGKADGARGEARAVDVGVADVSVVELAAEAALMQARLDELQRRLSLITGPPPGEGGG